MESRPLYPGEVCTVALIPRVLTNSAGVITGNGNNLPRDP